MNLAPRKIIIQIVLLFLLMTGATHIAFAAPVEIQSIRVVPTRVTVGKYPKITGRIKAKTFKDRNQSVEIIVIASVVWPNHVMKSWTWKKIKMKSGAIKSFSIPQVFKIKSAGTYKVDFNVYSKRMNPLHRLSKKFVVAKKKKAGKKRASPKKKASLPPQYPHVGIGVYANTLNGAGGATMLLWPFKYVGLQGSYSDGLFMITEGRLLARFPLSSGINPYLGVGYVNVSTERSVEVINIKTEFKDSGVSGVIGAEVPIIKNLFGYVEICGASIDLKKEVTSGGTTGFADVAFAPVSIGIGIVYFLF
jgi:hypothetical protein